MAERLKKLYRRSLKWLTGREPLVLFVLLLTAVAVWSFIEITDEVIEGSTQDFDQRVVRAMRQPNNPAEPIGPRWLHEFGRDATALGGVGALVLYTTIVVGYLWLDRKRRMVGFVLVSIVGGLLLSSGLKAIVSRPRPDVVPHLSIVYSSSFPSGHSMLSAVVYLTLGSLLAATTQQTVLRIYVLAVAVLLSVIVGVSRVYLGVHYPTDVLAGWVAGLGWALLCWLVARWMQRRRKVEQP